MFAGQRLQGTSRVESTTGAVLVPVALKGIVVQFGRLRDPEMTRPIVRDPMYRRRRFDAEIIERCVRWYITYRLSHRDLVAMMAERGASACRTPRFILGNPLCAGVREAMEPLLATGEYFLALDETYIKVRGKWSYLYRAVDKHGKTVDFLFQVWLFFRLFQFLHSSPNLPYMIFDWLELPSKTRCAIFG